MFKTLSRKKGKAVKHKLSKKSMQTISRITKGELSELDEHIEKQYGSSFEEGTVLRDDIKDRVFDLITLNFTDPKFRVHEHFTWEKMTMDAEDVKTLAMMILVEFNLEEIPFAETMKWTTVKDIVSYIETALECALHDMEETQIPASEGR